MKFFCLSVFFCVFVSANKLEEQIKQYESLKTNFTIHETKKEELNKFFVSFDTLPEKAVAMIQCNDEMKDELRFYMYKAMVDLLKKRKYITSLVPKIEDGFTSDEILDIEETFSSLFFVHQAYLRMLQYGTQHSMDHFVFVDKIWKDILKHYTINNTQPREAYGYIFFIRNLDKEWKNLSAIFNTTSADTEEIKIAKNSLSKQLQDVTKNLESGSTNPVLVWNKFKETLKNVEQHFSQKELSQIEDLLIKLNVRFSMIQTHYSISNTLPLTQNILQSINLNGDKKI